MNNRLKQRRVWKLRKSNNISNQSIEYEIYKKIRQEDISSEVDTLPKIQDYINQLRGEALGAKSCFTQYSFQSLAFTSAALALISTTLKNSALTAISALPLAVLLDGVMWIGIYKFVSANRAYGYQLYLEKALTLFYKDSDQNNEVYQENNLALSLILEKHHWEQTFRIYRIIEPTIFNKIYVSPEIKNNNIKIQRSKIIASEIIVSLLNAAFATWVAYVRYYSEIWGIIFGISVFAFSLFTLEYFQLFNYLKRLDPNNYCLNRYAQSRINQYMRKTDNEKYIEKPTLFNFYSVHETENNKNIFSPWFMLKKLYISEKHEHPNVIYHAGTYLKNMIRLLFMMQIFTLVPIILNIFACAKEMKLELMSFSEILPIIKERRFLDLVPIEQLDNIKASELTLLFIVLFIGALFIYCQYKQINRRRIIIEEELHSISSFSKIWHIVVITHYRAFCNASTEVNNDGTHSYDNSSYISRVIQEAESLSKDVFNLKEWFYKE